MRIILNTFFTALAVIFSFALLAQSGGPSNGSHLDLGVGASSRGVPVYVRFDTPIETDIHLGAMVSFRSYSDKINYIGGSDKWSHSIIGISGRGLYYFDNLLDLESKFDVYAGLSLGFFIVNTSYKGSREIDYEYTGTASGGVGVGLIAGGRYYWNDTWGLNVELGGGTVLSGANVGVTKRF